MKTRAGCHRICARIVTDPKSPETCASGEGGCRMCELRYGRAPLHREGAERGCHAAAIALPCAAARCDMYFFVAVLVPLPLAQWSSASNKCRSTSFPTSVHIFTPVGVTVRARAGGGEKKKPYTVGSPSPSSTSLCVFHSTPECVCARVCEISRGSLSLPPLCLSAALPRLPI